MTPATQEGTEPTPPPSSPPLAPVKLEPAPVASTAARVTPIKTSPRRGFRGSALTYGHQATAYTFDRGAEPLYNPTWSHRLGVSPEWHFTDQLYVRGRLFLTQEFTASDVTRHKNEVELSDLALEVGASGWTEQRTGLRLGADFRVAFPTSKTSRAATRLLAIGPGLSVSRALPFGFTVAYGGRYSYRFHQFTTAQNDTQCHDALSAECAELVATGRRNAHSDLTHGPAISWAPTEKLSANAAFQLTHLWLYPLSTPTGAVPAPERADVAMRQYTNFDLSVSYQLFRPLGVTLGASTFSPQLNTFGTRYFPLFNRNTTLYLDLSFDFEAAASGLLGEST